MLRNFLKAFADKFVISTRADRGAHLSASVFADNAKVVFDLYKGNSQEEFRRLVDTIPHLRESGSNMDKALRLAKQDIFSLKGGTRQSASKVLILITAGNCAGCKEPLATAVQPIKDGGIQVITLGIGNKVDQADLEKMSDYPTRANLFKRQNIEQLINAVFIQKISEAACKGKLCFKILFFSYIRSSLEVWELKFFLLMILCYSSTTQKRGLVLNSNYVFQIPFVWMQGSVGFSLDNINILCILQCKIQSSILFTLSTIVI